MTQKFFEVVAQILRQKEKIECAKCPLVVCVAAHTERFHCPDATRTQTSPKYRHLFIINSIQNMNKLVLISNNALINCVL